jgi:acetyltransferase-like isoleucine patch superfamily enzyme
VVKILGIEDKINAGFYHYGENVGVASNVVFQNINRIYVGSNIIIRESCEIVVNSEYANENFKYNLKIEDNVFLNRYVCIEAYNQVIVGKYVMFGPQVYVSDGNHSYEDINVPIRLQALLQSSNKVIIKDGAWIGSGSKIIGNVIIGFGSVVAANTVVVKDVPDHCMFAGVPGTIIKVYNYKTNKWLNVKDNPKLLKKVLLERGTFGGYDYNWINEELKKNKESVNIKTGNLEECNKYIELIGTIIEGLNYINEKLVKGEFDKTVDVLNDIVSGIYTILKGTSCIIAKEKPKILLIKEEVERNLNLIITEVERKNTNTVISNINLNLIPTLIKLKSFY